MENDSMAAQRSGSLFLRHPTPNTQIPTEGGWVPRQKDVHKPCGSKNVPALASNYLTGRSLLNL